VEAPFHHAATFYTHAPLVDVFAQVCLQLLDVKNASLAILILIIVIIRDVTAGQSTCRHAS
jgi:hypothetical protein